MDEVLKQLQELKELAVLGAKNVLNMEDVCFLTGYSKSHLYKLVWSRRIPYYKSEGGKMTYFKKQEIENWLMAYRVPSAAETEQAAINHCITSNRKGAGK